MGEVKVNRLLEKLQLKEFKLSSLLEVTKAINENFNTDKLLNLYEYILHEQLGISKLVLYHYDNIEWSCLLRYGAKGKAKKVDVKRDLSHISEITVIESSSSDSLNSFDLVVPIMHKDRPLAYLLIGDLNEDELIISPTIKHMPFVQTLTNIIIVAIENKRFANESIIQERANREMELAAEMQKLLFPAKLPSNNRMEVAAHYESLHLIGGDYYDFIQLNNEEYVLCIADVSGKGVPAALLMSNFQANLRANIKYNHEGLSIENLIRELNKNVNDSANGEKFITFFLAYYNSTNRVLKYINAGHNHPILTDGKTAKHLNKGCIGLGMFEELPFIEVEEIVLKPNDTLVCFTDGLVELENEEGEQFETERLINTIHDNFHLRMKDLNKLIFFQLEKYKGDAEYEDDTAAMSCRFF